MQHEFIKNAQSRTILQKMLSEAREIQEAQNNNTANGEDSVSWLLLVDRIFILKAIVVFVSVVRGAVHFTDFLEKGLIFLCFAPSQHSSILYISFLKLQFSLSTLSCCFLFLWSTCTCRGSNLLFASSTTKKFDNGFIRNCSVKIFSRGTESYTTLVLFFMFVNVLICMHQLFVL